MHVLITRPVNDAEPFKTRVEALGCRVTLAPLLQIVPNAIAADALRNATALVATSRNALAALSRSPALPSAIQRPIYVVGPATAAIARKIGFTEIIEGAGAAADLASLLVSDAGSSDSHLIYLRGDVVAFDLEAVLTQASVNVTPLTVYHSAAAETLPAEVIKVLQDGGIDAVTLMSPRAAGTWARLVAALSPPVKLAGIAHLCLSQQVAKALGQPREDDKIMIARHPDMEEMLALVRRVAASSSAV